MNVHRSSGVSAVALGHAVSDIVPKICIIDKLQECSSPEDGPIVKPQRDVPGISFGLLGAGIAAAELEETVACMEEPEPLRI